MEDRRRRKGGIRRADGARAYQHTHVEFLEKRGEKGLTLGKGHGILSELFDRTARESAGSEKEEKSA